MKKVLFATNSCGGLYKFRAELIKAVLDKGYQAVVLGPCGDKVEELRNIGCDFYEMEFARHGTNPFAEMKLKRRYKKILKEIKPDIALTYTIKPNIYAGIACTKLKIPYLANIT